MENRIINLDYESMSNEELAQIQEKIKETRLKKIEKKTSGLEDRFKKLKNAFDLLKDDNNKIKEKNQQLEDNLKSIQKETNQITKTLFTHGKEKRELENHLHEIIYKELEKNSTRDELFHGDLTRICKYELCKSLGVSSFAWIEVKDVDIAKRLAYKILNKEFMHRLMRNKTKDLQLKMDKLQTTNKKPTEREYRKFELLEELLEEVEGNENRI
ncbi:TPA: hypothetical protein ACXDAY_002323 [Clostridium botulinum]|uniref:hypothetical protein n=1 Tax=Clostridium botulinum TaxID=1491 RepID=UPI000772F23D|nr:hypothetical protein [Clostridium botulinum]APH20821.1 hypothetical protein NPD1_4329 [Clostridium botulinum]APQ71181.1 hypothetical protein RSJ8_4286 [Clostridium botulinum]AUN01649.1 hypothetical protein RSJ19_01340 [Clostridium botulinum]MBN3351981.1 hypothetical protein [Clostridium botulinum]MBN3359371.1 hypothetical protein [Clostridium botulinum]